MSISLRYRDSGQRAGLRGKAEELSVLIEFTSFAPHIVFISGSGALIPVCSHRRIDPTIIIIGTITPALELNMD